MLSSICLTARLGYIISVSSSSPAYRDTHQWGLYIYLLILFYIYRYRLVRDGSILYSLKIQAHQALDLFAMPGWLFHSGERNRIKLICTHTKRKEKKIAMGHVYRLWAIYITNKRQRWSKKIQNKRNLIKHIRKQALLPTLLYYLSLFEASTATHRRTIVSIWTSLPVTDIQRSTSWRDSTNLFDSNRFSLIIPDKKCEAIAIYTQRCQGYSYFFLSNDQ